MLILPSPLGKIIMSSNGGVGGEGGGIDVESMRIWK